MKSGIFQAWTWYWISLYGTLTSALLVVISFIFVLTNTDGRSLTLFTTFWVIGLSFLAITVLLGFRILKVTKKTVGKIVESHQAEIAALLRESATGQYEVM